MTRALNNMHVALLRAVNVGARNKVPMKDLTAIFTALGCRSVTTYIQSGNVVFDAARADPHELGAAVSRRVKKQFGFDVPVMVRSASELDAVVRRNPFAKKGASESALHVLFLADEPSAKQVSTLDPERSPGDEFEVRGSHVYLCCPSGVARTKLSNAWFESKLEMLGTIRNWRTVSKLRDLSAGR